MNVNSEFARLLNERDALTKQLNDLNEAYLKKHNALVYAEKVLHNIRKETHESKTRNVIKDYFFQEYGHLIK